MMTVVFTSYVGRCSQKDQRSALLSHFEKDFISITVGSLHSLDLCPTGPEQLMITAMERKLTTVVSNLTIIRRLKPMKTAIRIHYSE